MAYPRSEHPQHQIDKVYLQRQAEINNINYVDGNQMLDYILTSFEGAGASFANDIIKDAYLRDKYTLRIRYISNETLNAVKNKQISVADAYRFCSQMRNSIMEEIRTYNSAIGRAYSINLKESGLKADELLNKYAYKLYDRSFENLYPNEKKIVQYHIIESAGKHRISVTNLTKKLKIIGKVLWVVTGVLAIYAIVNADDKIKETLIQASTITGGLGGGAIGSALGSLVCAPAAFLCFGTLILIFSSLGAVFASWSSEIIYEEAQEFISWNLI